MNGNLLADIPQHASDEVFTALLDAPHIRIERIVSHGHASPADFWYDQDHSEWVLVLQGAARLGFQDGRPPVELGPGDWCNIPAGAQHRVEWTTPHEPTVWLAVHY
jgi:cupin 2 domain-containing protein